MAIQAFQKKIERQFPPNFRKEIMPRIMEAVTNGESCFIVGVSGTGKSNLFRFIRSQAAEDRYLAQSTGRFAFIWADTNALAGELSALHLYELILYNLLKWVEENRPPGVSYDYLHDLHEKVVLSENRVLAQRHLETTLRYLFNKIDELHIILLFDEFEPIGQTLDFQFFRSLRWLRDEFKYYLVYIMAAHRSPIGIRRELFDQGEAFYELLAPNILGLSMYNAKDTEFMITELSKRYGIELPAPRKEVIYNLSGGHGGLIAVIFKVLFKHGLPHDEAWQIEQLLAYDSVAGECRKIWNSLETKEQDTLIALLKQDFVPAEPPPLNSLIAKGIIKKDEAGQISTFSSLFQTFMQVSILARLEEEAKTL